MPKRDLQNHVGYNKEWLSAHKYWDIHAPTSLVKSPFIGYKMKTLVSLLSYFAVNTCCRVGPQWEGIEDEISQREGRRHKVKGKEMPREQKRRECCYWHTLLLSGG